MNTQIDLFDICVKFIILKILIFVLIVDILFGVLGFWGFGVLGRRAEDRGRALGYRAI